MSCMESAVLTSSLSIAHDGHLFLQSNCKLMPCCLHRRVLCNKGIKYEENWLQSKRQGHHDRQQALACQGQ
eukprot:1159848-Pelagomonas_calceolata.AAC.2